MNYFLDSTKNQYEKVASLEKKLEKISLKIKSVEQSFQLKIENERQRAEEILNKKLKKLQEDYDQKMNNLRQQSELDKLKNELETQRELLSYCLKQEEKIQKISTEINKKLEKSSGQSVPEVQHATENL